MNPFRELSETRKRRIAEKFATNLVYGWLVACLPLVLLLILGHFQIRNPFPEKISIFIPLLPIFYLGLSFTLQGIWGMATGYLVAQWGWWQHNHEKPDWTGQVNGSLSVFVGLLLLGFVFLMIYSLYH